MTYKQAIRKFQLESIIVKPMVWIGRIIGYVMPLKKKHGAFLFFSNADLGGAPKVNAQISETIMALNPLVIFSKKPKNNGFLNLFERTGVDTIDLHKKIDNKLFHFINIIYRGIIGSWIKRSGARVVFGGECIYFYKIIPHINKDIKAIELCHLNTWFNYSQTFIGRIDVRIFSTQNVMQQVIEQYRTNGIEKKYFDRLRFIDNYIDIPLYTAPNNKTLQVLFVGRGAPQKRVPLMVAIAEQLHQQNVNVHFSFVGDVSNVTDIGKHPYCTFFGNVKDQQQLEKIYEQSDCLILTSAYEGLPLVVMQMMALGRAVVSTAVDGIPDYVQHEYNGLLIQSKTEADIVAEGVLYIIRLVNDYEFCIKLGLNGRAFAEKHFSKEVFEQSYKDLFELA